MDDELISQFTAITSADPQRAQQYLTLTEGNLEQAIQLYFDSDGMDMGASMPQAAAPSQPARPASGPGYTEDEHGTVTIDSDDDDEVQYTGSGQGQQSNTYEDDEALARRLQEEAYGSGGGMGREDEIRAPMARTTETLVGPGSSWGAGGGGGDDDMRAAIAQQMMARQRRAGRPGIFNQRAEDSVWAQDDNSDPEERRRTLARATGGASEASAKSNLLAELFRPPVDSISHSSWDDARDEGKEEEKWISINIQDPSIFDCQVLNRDIWKNAQIKETVSENFIFMQYTKDDPRAGQYVNYYFQNRDIEDAYPHIAIVDPRTGEQVKLWSGAPVPKPADFLMDSHEFLDRYSSKAFAKNPVATRKPEKKTKDVERMTEEEMLEMAMQNSLANGGGPSTKDDDPDALTKADSKGKNKIIDPDAMDTADMGVPANGNAGSSSAAVGAFSQISSTNPHEEPTDPAGSTRIQFRYSGGRQVRKFALADHVRRMYEWLKASPIDGKEGSEFELIFMGKNLIDSLDKSIEEAGSKNGSVMVEFVEE